jgi:serine/threonine protein kinase
MSDARRFRHAAYMAPEQVEEARTPAADIYALGVVMTK